MHFLKMIAGRRKKDSSHCSFPSPLSLEKENNLAAKGCLSPGPGYRGKDMPIGLVSSTKVLQMLGPDKEEEKEEILLLMNQTRVYSDSPSPQTASCSEEEEGHEEDRCEIRSHRVAHGEAGHQHAVAVIASSLSSNPLSQLISTAGKRGHELNSNSIIYVNPHLREQDLCPAAHPLPTPPLFPTPSSPPSSSTYKVMKAQQPMPQSTTVAFPLPKAQLEKRTSHQNYPALQQHFQSFEAASSCNGKILTRIQPSELVSLPRVSTSCSSPTSTPLVPSSFQGSQLPSPPRTPSSQAPPFASSHLPSHPQFILHSPWSFVPVPQCPRVWTKGQKLGQGSFGTVYEGLNQEDGSFFAVKISSQNDTSAEIQQEVKILSRLSHPNIVRYLGSSIEDGCLCIFLELVGMGSIASILRKYKRLEEHLICTYTRQVLYGLEYLHQQSTIHRDIKCANILVDANGLVKLADFGVAKRVDVSLADSCKGTPVYMAPEVMKPSSARESYSFSADIWSLGCTVLEMADGKPPWKDVPGFGFYFKVSTGELPPIPKHLSANARDFILRCLRLRPNDRPTASELLQHPFVKNAPMAIPPFPSLPTSTGTSHEPSFPWLQSASASANISSSVPSSPRKTCNAQVLVGAHNSRALLYG